MLVANIEIDFEPGETYNGNAEPADKAGARQTAIAAFKAAAQKTCKGQMYEVTNHLLGLVVQLRAVDGSDPQLAKRLREMADFLEDL
jgi:hypothetical protein